MEEEVFREMENRKNVRVKEVGQELWVFNNFWSKTYPIVKFKEWKGLPKYFINDMIDTCQKLFWEDFQVETVDIKECYEDMKRDRTLKEVYEKWKGRKGFVIEQ